MMGTDIASRPRSRAMRGLSMVLLAVVCTDIAALASAADAGAGLTDLMQRFAERRHGHAAFVERQYLRVLDRPLESSGELFFTAPDRLETRTLKPKPESLLLEKGTLSVQRGGRNYTIAARDYPQVAALVDGIRATLAGDLAALELAYTLTYEPVGDDWTLTLVPRASKAAALIAQMRIAGHLDAVREVTVLRANGDRSVMTIHELPDD
jgi:hypothetical protein